MKELVFLLKERSAEEMLKGLLPRIAVSMPPVRYIVFEGKSDLEKRFVRKMRAYVNPHAIFVILRDQDSGDCKEIKQRLVERCIGTGKPFIVRIICHELENWYLADLSAVERGLGIDGLGKNQEQAKYRAPDALSNASQELSRIAPIYQKVSGSRSIGKYLDPVNRRSQSFFVFVQGIMRLLEW